MTSAKDAAEVQARHAAEDHQLHVAAFERQLAELKHHAADSLSNKALDLQQLQRRLEEAESHANEAAEKIRQELAEAERQMFDKGREAEDRLRSEVAKRLLAEAKSTAIREAADAREHHLVELHSKDRAKAERARVDMEKEAADALRSE